MVEADTVGKELFGRATRLRLCLWIWQRDKDFYQSEPPSTVGAQSSVNQELIRLTRLGMVREERRDDSRRLYYVREDHPLWTIIAAASQVLSWTG